MRTRLRGISSYKIRRVSDGKYAVQGTYDIPSFTTSGKTFYSMSDLRAHLAKYKMVQTCYKLCVVKKSYFLLRKYKDCEIVSLKKDNSQITCSIRTFIFNNFNFHSTTKYIPQSYKSHKCKCELCFLETKTMFNDICHNRKI